jgi:hypothetical protein
MNKPTLSNQQQSVTASFSGILLTASALLVPVAEKYTSYRVRYRFASYDHPVRIHFPSKMMVGCQVFDVHDIGYGRHGNRFMHATSWQVLGSGYPIVSQMMRQTAGRRASPLPNGSLKR